MYSLSIHSYYIIFVELNTELKTKVVAPSHNLQKSDMDFILTITSFKSLDSSLIEHFITAKNYF